MIAGLYYHTIPYYRWELSEFIGHAVEQTHWKLIFSRRRARSSRGAALVDEALGFCMRCSVRFDAAKFLCCAGRQKHLLRF